MMPVYYVQFRAMGCSVTVQLQTNADGRSILNTLPDRLEVYEQILSRFRTDSELSGANRQAGSPVKVSPILLENIRLAIEAARISDGWFNPLILPALRANGYDRSFEKLERVVAVQTSQPAQDWRLIDLDLEASSICIPAGSALDLGGIAKGWVAGWLADELAVYGACSVNIGGDIAVRGVPQGRSGWEIGVTDPLSKANIAYVTLKDTSIVTSGIDYRQWRNLRGDVLHHIINPFTGYPAKTDLVGVTISHPSTTRAEVYAKVVLLLGAKRGLEWIRKDPEAAVLLFKKDGEVLSNTTFNQLMTERVYS
jgi:thiamine biosynthesis lipoprotein